jgi:hypothetical protein
VATAWLCECLTRAGYSAVADSMDSARYRRNEKHSIQFCSTSPWWLLQADTMYERYSERIRGWIRTQFNLHMNVGRLEYKSDEAMESAKMRSRVEHGVVAFEMNMDT